MEVGDMVEDKIVKRILVDPETGEQIYFYEGDRIVRATSTEMLSDTEKLDIKGFVKGSVEELMKVLPELSTSEKAFLISVAPYVGYSDCCLKYPSNGNELTSNHLMNISGLSKSVLYSAMNGLIKKDILYKGKNSKNRQYFVNPWIFNKGIRTNRVLKTMFKNYRIRSMNNVKWGSLGD